MVITLFLWLHMYYAHFAFVRFDHSVCRGLCVVSSLMTTYIYVWVCIVSICYNNWRFFLTTWHKFSNVGLYATTNGTSCTFLLLLLLLGLIHFNLFLSKIVWKISPFTKPFFKGEPKNFSKTYITWVMRIWWNITFYKSVFA